MANRVTVSGTEPIILGAVTATGETEAAARAVISVYSAAEVDALLPAEVVLPLCPYATTGGPLTAVGRLRFDPASYARPGGTLSAALDVVADVSADGLTGTITLWNMTDNVEAATLLVTSSTWGNAQNTTVPVPGAAKSYELRASLAGGDGYLTLGAVLRLHWS